MTFGGDKRTDAPGADSAAGPGFGGLTNGYFGPPATYGVTLGVNF